VHSQQDDARVCAELVLVRRSGVNGLKEQGKRQKGLRGAGVWWGGLGPCGVTPPALLVTSASSQRVSGPPGRWARNLQLNDLKAQDKRQKSLRGMGVWWGATRNRPDRHIPALLHTEPSPVQGPQGDALEGTGQAAKGPAWDGGVGGLGLCGVTSALLVTPAPSQRASGPPGRWTRNLPAAPAAVPAANLGPGTRPEPAPTTHGGHGRNTTGGWLADGPRVVPLRPRACGKSGAGFGVQERGARYTGGAIPRVRGGLDHRAGGRN
jgi:hypothetical protein